MTHRGEILSKAIEKSQLKKTQIAKLFKCSTRYIYDLIQKEKIPNDVMINFLTKLGYNYELELPELVEFQAIREPEALYKAQANYREKYFELMEKHIKVMEELERYKNPAPSEPSAPKTRQKRKSK
jgi:plasmid maintenance system antidote protein VapI